ncbi:hypothetical protein LSAT2_009540 [Lamellibrachia satsuma]|nr:hypothetical protein LSAT2_009540 [Lamellibrachia satsuma]
MRRWGYIDDTQSLNCNCGELQTMAHLLCCRLLDEACTAEDLVTVTERAKACARKWQHIVAAKLVCEDEAILQHIEELVQELGPGADDDDENEDDNGKEGEDDVDMDSDSEEGEETEGEKGGKGDSEMEH